MRLEPGQVAVVTGGASGIGRAMVDAFAARGLAVVLADVEQGALDAAAEELTARGATVLAGRVDVVCNNAGVITRRLPVWEQSFADWKWAVDVNLHGVANGIRAFVPHLVAAGRGHVVNTASMAGLSTVPGGGNGAYSATKHAVVGLSETLRLELSLHAPDVGVTVLCPGPVPSRIHDAARNRPDDGTPADADGSAARSTDFGLVLRRVPADEVAQQVLGAIEARREYVVTSSDIVPLARERVEHLLAELSER